MARNNSVKKYTAVRENKTRLCVTLQGQVHVARVMSKGSIKDSGGKLFLTPTDWFQSVLGNNAPVSSACVWDKVRSHQVERVSFFPQCRLAVLNRCYSLCPLFLFFYL